MNRFLTWVERREERGMTAIEYGMMATALAVLVALVGWIPLEETEALADARDWLVRVPVSAGARGILIGVGLGTVAAGVRVLTGQDRSIRG